MNKILTLKQIKDEITKVRKEKGSDRAPLPVPLKRDTINIHYKTGMKISIIAKEIDVSSASVHVWKKLYGDERTGSVHGTGIRNDKRTVGLAVKEFIEDKVPQHALAKKYDVSASTIASWVARYRITYKDLLNYDDGIMVVAKQENLVYGNENIRKVMKLLVGQEIELSKLVLGLQDNGFSKTVVNEAKKKQTKVKKDMKIMEEASKIAEEVEKKTKK